MTTALLDGDIFIFRSAAASENEDLEIAISRMDRAIQMSIDAIKADKYRFFISGDENFRYKVNPEYKANRKGKPDPKWRNSLIEHAVLNWNGEVTHGIEADDALGINQGNGTIICSIDKDLHQISGDHYSFELSGRTAAGETWLREAFFKNISPVEGLQFFYKQLLIGDRADNIFGVDRIGPVGAAKAIDHLVYEEDMFEVVRDLYNDDARMLMNARCLHIFQKEENYWQDTELGALLAREVSKSDSLKK
jgi:5'-3' exonuclease